MPDSIKNPNEDNNKNDIEKNKDKQPSEHEDPDSIKKPIIDPSIDPSGNDPHEGPTKTP